MNDTRSLTRGAILYAGDLLMLLLFTFIGSREHHLGLSLWSTFLTALPFILTWTAFGLAFGAFHSRAYAGWVSAAAVPAIPWAFALISGLIIRLFLYGKPIFTVFGILALVFIYLFLLAWRLVFTWIVKRSAPPA